MNHSEEENKYNKVVKAKKVRRGFIHKTYRMAEVVPIVSPSKFLDFDNVHLLHPAFPVIEVAGKILIEDRFLSSVNQISSCTVEPFQNKKKVIIWMEPNAHAVTIPWKYHIERLKSFGDKDLFVWSTFIEFLHDQLPIYAKNIQLS